MQIKIVFSGFYTFQGDGWGPSIRYSGSHLFPMLRQTFQLVSKKNSISLMYLWMDLLAGHLVSSMSLKASQYFWSVCVLLLGMWENWLISDRSYVLQKNEESRYDSHPLFFMHCWSGMLVFNGQNLLPQDPARKQVKSPQPSNQINECFYPFSVVFPTPCSGIIAIMTIFHRTPTINSNFMLPLLLSLHHSQ